MSFLSHLMGNYILLIIILIILIGFQIFLQEILQGTELFYSSPIVNKNDKIYFSSSVSTFSINTNNGSINWELPFSTNLRPIVTDQFVFLASKEGFIVNIDNATGKVIWSKSLYKKKSKPKKIKLAI